MSSRRALRYGLACVVLAGVLAAAAGGCLAWVAGPDSRLDRLTHFAPLYPMAALLGLAFALAARLPWRGAIAASCLVAVAASCTLIVPEFTRSNGAEPASAPTGRIKVIQFNAQRGNADVRRVADWLIAQDPDVVTISEARHDLRDLLLKRAGWKVAGGQGSLMIFTRERYVRMNRPKGLRGSSVTFVNATYAAPTGDIEILTTHLDRRPATPVPQVRGLEHVTRALPRERMILTGDFNATPWSGALRRLDSSLGLTRRDRAVASWPAELLGGRWPLPFLPIDHVYAGPGWATVKVERGPWLGSDHYPVIVTLAPVARP